MREPSDYSNAFADLLARLGVEAVLAGALAANRWRATPRFTTDVDFLVGRLDGVAEALAAEGYEIKAMSEPGTDDPYLIFVRGDGIRVDLMLATTAYHREALGRAADGALAVEDVIISKLIAWRPRDRDDIREILVTDPDLDVDYIDEWCAVWEVADRWAESRRLS